MRGCGRRRTASLTQAAPNTPGRWTDSGQAEPLGPGDLSELAWPRRFAHGQALAWLILNLCQTAPADGRTVWSCPYNQWSSGLTGSPARSDFRDATEFFGVGGGHSNWNFGARSLCAPLAGSAIRLSHAAIRHHEFEADFDEPLFDAPQHERKG